MSEAKARKILHEIVQRNTRITKSNSTNASDFFDCFKNKRYNNKRFVDILTNLCKGVVPDVERHLRDFEKNLELKTPLDSLIIFLFTIVPNLKQSIKVVMPDTESKTNIPTKQKISIPKTATEFESPALSSTKISTHENDVLVSEVREKLAQVAQHSPQSLRSSSTPIVNLRKSLNGPVQNKPLKTTPSVHSPLSSTWNFRLNDDSILPIQVKTAPSVIAIPFTAQERLLITELLYTLIGINGSLIVPKLVTTTVDYQSNGHITETATCKEQVLEFEINAQVQPSLKDILLEILPLANCFYQIQNFIEEAQRLESGQVLQALSAALRKLVNDYFDSIAQLESMHSKHQLNLQKLLYFLRPVKHTMETIAMTISELKAYNTRGGNVLTRLHDSIGLLSGDRRAQEILIYLTQMSAEPYMEILKLWIYKGIIIDPQQEFLIEENKQDYNPELDQDIFSAHWEKQYVIRMDKVPRFLEKQADMILRTGKYLNVIRECGKIVPQKEASNLKFSHTNENYLTLINDAYSFASKALLELIMDDNDLMGRLQSIKRYFLLQQGDFIAQFMDACEQELAKSVDDVIPMRLENLLELTLRLSSAKYDKYQDELGTHLLEISFGHQIAKILQNDDGYLEEAGTFGFKGIECFTFNYHPQWPVSIVLNHMTISKYQMIFRLLFYCKHVERLLCRVWIANNNAKKFAPKTAELYRSAFTLRQRMMNAIQNLEYYMMIEVIEPSWHEFLQKIGKVKNIDDVLQHHDDFLMQCLKNCMLIDSKLLKLIIKLCNICIEFCNFIEGESSSLQPSETFSQKVNRFDSDFTGKLIELLTNINEVAAANPSEKFVNLIHRINFNSFYADKLDFLYTKDTN